MNIAMRMAMLFHLSLDGAKVVSRIRRKEIVQLNNTTYTGVSELFDVSVHLVVK